MLQRAILILSSLVVAAQILIFHAAVSAQSDNIRVLFYPPWNISKLPMYFAREMGIFERNGLKIAWDNPGSNGKLLDTLKHGAADIAVVSAMSVDSATPYAPARLLEVWK